jgi:hypothetical protein
MPKLRRRSSAKLENPWHGDSDSDNDSVATASTVCSYREEDATYIVDTILAEKSVNGTKLYLIKWEGYELQE